jgi:23S rRNA pseudouridine2605 synthase
VIVDGIVNTEKLEKLQKGIDIGDHYTAPADVQILDHGLKEQDNGKSIQKEKKSSTPVKLNFKISEGKHRQIRRMCQALDLFVVDLKRVSIGPIQLGNLKEGMTRHLSQKELEILKEAIA